MSEATHSAVAQIEAALKNAGLLEFSGEVQLLEWSKSSSRDGPKIKLLLPDDDAVAPFESATIKKGRRAGQLYHVFAIRIDEDTREQGAVSGKGVGADTVPGQHKHRTPGNKLAQALHKFGYFNNLKLWQGLHRTGIYTQSLHKAYIESLPCYCASPEMQSIPGMGACQGDVCAHHCSSAANPAAGHDTDNPRKPPHWYCLPMCHQHHTIWCHSSVGAGRDAKAVMREAAVLITAKRVKEAMKRHLGIESLAEITIAELNHFEDSINLGRTVFDER